MKEETSPAIAYEMQLNGLKEQVSPRQNYCLTKILRRGRARWRLWHRQSTSGLINPDQPNELKALPMDIKDERPQGKKTSTTSMSTSYL